VNNAGQGDRVSLEDTTPEVFRRQIETNFFGTVYVTKAAIPLLRAQGGGRIIQISSLGGRIGSPGMTAYQSAKWASVDSAEVVVGESARAMPGFEHVATSDPQKVARLVLTVAGLNEPPLRILAGSDAYEYGCAAWRHRIETDAKWEYLSRSTDHDDAGDQWQRQRGSSLPDMRA
jgi:hypothetical protein